MFEMKLELVPLPVSDIDAAKAFYAEKLGFNVDHDTRPNESIRLVQLTPPGSGCSILLSSGLGELSQMIPGSVKGLHLVVKDIKGVREMLISKGVEVGAINEYPGGIKDAGFRDPDGNSWNLQEMSHTL